MKKFLTSAIAAALVATSVGALVACGDKDSGNNNKDAELAQKGLATVIQLTESIPEETPENYLVIGQTNAGGKKYDVKWSVSSEFPEYTTYVSVGEKDSSGKVTINITKATEVVEYTLTATVTVGKASKSEDFQHKIPATQAGEDQNESSLDLTGNTNRTVFTDEQMVWTANGITLTNTKGTNGTKITDGDNTYHARLYQGTTVKIEYPSIEKIVFYSDRDQGTTSYHNNLKTVLTAANKGEFTADDENRTITLTLTNPADEIEFAATKQMRLTRIDIVANKAALTDEQKVDAALAQTTIDQTNYTKIGTYDLPASKGNFNITWTLKEAASEYASITSNKLNVTSMPASETPLTLVASITSGDVTKTKEISIKLVPLDVDNDGSLEHPYTAAEAWQVAKTLSTDTTDEFYVKGYVALPGTYSGEKFNNFDNMYITDSYDATTEYSYADYTNGEYIGLFYIYRPKAQGEYLTAEGLKAGDEVTFKGKLGNYQGTSPQLANGGICVARTEAADLNKGDQEKVDTAKTNITLNATYIAGNVTLPTSQNGASLSWAVKSGAGVTISGNTMTIGETAEGEITLTVTITSGTVTDTKDISFTVTVVNYGKLDAPLSVTEANALAKAQCTGRNAATKQVVYMTGKLTNAPTERTNSSDNSVWYQNLTLADLNDPTNTILVYSINLRDSVAAPAQNDVLIVCGYIVNYYYNDSTTTGTIEFTSSNSTNVYLESNTRGTSTITLGAHDGATVDIAETATNGATVTFTVTADSGKEIANVKVNNKTITGSEGSYSFTMIGNMTVTVDTKDAGAADPVTANVDYSKQYSANTVINGTEVKDKDVTIVFATNGGSTAPQYYANGTSVRAYGSNSITVSVPAGYTIVKITFTFGSSDTPSKAITANKGTFDTDKWTGSEQSVVFTVDSGSGNRRIAAIEIEYMAPTTEGETETQTLSLPEALPVED